MYKIDARFDCFAKWDRFEVSENSNWWRWKLKIITTSSCWSRHSRICHNQQNATLTKNFGRLRELRAWLGHSSYKLVCILVKSPSELAEPGSPHSIDTSLESVLHRANLRFVQIVYRSIAVGSIFLATSGPRYRLAEGSEYIPAAAILCWHCKPTKTNAHTRAPPARLLRSSFFERHFLRSSFQSVGISREE